MSLNKIVVYNTASQLVPVTIAVAHIDDPATRGTNIFLYKDTCMELQWNVTEDAQRWFKINALLEGEFTFHAILERTGGNVRYDSDVAVATPVPTSYWLIDNTTPASSAPGAAGVFQDEDSNSLSIEMTYTPDSGKPCNYSFSIAAYLNSNAPTGLKENLSLIVPTFFGSNIVPA